MANNKPNNNGSAAKKAQPPKNQTVQTTTTTKTEEKAMIDKVNDKMTPREDSFLARFIGTALIVLGILFVLLAILVVALSRRPASVNGDLPVPSIQAPAITNRDQIRVTGETVDNGTVMFWVDGNVYTELAEADDDGDFEIEIEAEDEREYEIQAAYVRGFPLKQRSEKSDVERVIVDRTPPSSDAKLDYEKVVSGNEMTIRGNTDPNTKVIVEIDGKEYTTMSDENGDFEIKGIILSEGENSISVALEDEAGNRTEVDQEVVVEYVPGGDLDGDGIRDIGVDTDGDGIPDSDTGADLPEAAGELEAAMDFLFGNKLMLLFGILALAIFGLNAGLVAVKLKKN
ncbi:MAG: hypothetical protein QY318_00660 [Candidatus Dojkabacteria bacterium]|nr:MAG: hypothetical protein QY318_00660 [Candidatus Dojkabacteria bacterium]